MSTLPREPLPGTSELGEVRLYDVPFDPCFDLLVDGAAAATLFYDDKPEAAYAEVASETRVPGAAAGLHEKEVGWCLQFSDEPRDVSVPARGPSDLVQQGAWGRMAIRRRAHSAARHLAGGRGLPALDRLNSV